jgi:hypothetical protein
MHVPSSAALKRWPEDRGGAVGSVVLILVFLVGSIADARGSSVRMAKMPGRHVALEDAERALRRPSSVIKSLQSLAPEEPDRTADVILPP